MPPRQENEPAIGGKSGPYWLPANVYDPNRHKSWDFRESIPGYAVEGSEVKVCQDFILFTKLRWQT